MLTGAQVREARALLGWSRGNLSRRGTLSLNMICRAEASDGEAGITLGHRIVMRAAFQKAGVVFAVEDGIPVVKLCKTLLRQLGPPQVPRSRRGELTMTLTSFLAALHEHHDILAEQIEFLERGNQIRMHGEAPEQFRLPEALQDAAKRPPLGKAASL